MHKWFMIFMPFFWLLMTTDTLNGITTTINKRTDARRIAVVIDQPAGLVMGMESQVLADIVERLDQTIDDLTLTVVNPKNDGSLYCRRDEKTVSMSEFDVLWLYREYSWNDTPITSEESFLKSLKEFLSHQEKGIVLMGHASQLFEPLGFGKLEITPHEVEIDCQQVGIVPYSPDAPLFSGTIIDRKMISMSHATYHTYRQFKTSSPNVVSYATTHEPWFIPLYAGLIENPDGSKRTGVLVFPWLVNYVYEDAAEEFRHNFETLSLNLVRQSGRLFRNDDIVPPKFTLPDFAALRRALNDLIENHDEDYPKGEEYLKKLESLEKQALSIRTADQAEALNKDFLTLQRESLLANPVLDFTELLFIRRDPNNLGFPENFNSNSSLKRTGYSNELARFNFRTDKSSVIFTPSHDEFIGDVDLYFDANKLLFSMPDANEDYRFRLWELTLDSNELKENSRLKKISTIEESDVDNYDACYLPDDRIVFCSTACFTGVPCINGQGHICNLYQRTPNGKIRQLTIEQDHDWSPTVMSSGRLMYLRWEYTDLPHVFSRILFHCNPDGTNQSALYGSGSWWPVGMFYAREIPNEPTKFIAIATGHHDINRIGDLVLFSPAQGRQETEGAIQRIPGWGKKVNSVPLDYAIRQNWPKFVHPFPLSDKYFIVSCKRSPESPWEICLVDIFDNIVTLRSEPDFALLEPIPLRKTDRPPIIPDRISPENKEAEVSITNIYEGEGLRGIPRDTIKSLRIFSYHFSYQGMGGEPHSIGLDGPWDPKRLLGTVPVYKDGSASFKIPANVPIAFQPLDNEGKAVQLMRSWVTAMPGETISCVGCHEKQNMTFPLTARTIAAQKKPVTITPFLGPPRGLSFAKEIQPILDHYCVECHQPESPKTQEILANSVKNKNSSLFEEIPDFRNGPVHSIGPGRSMHVIFARFTTSYLNLRKFVHTPTKESPITVLKPYQFHADSTRLVQVLQSGHYGVKLDSDSWDRLITWIDLNAPFYGNWGESRNYEIAQLVENQWQRRSDLRKLYTNNGAELDDGPVTNFQEASVFSSSKNDSRNNVFRDLPDPPVRVKNVKTFDEASSESIQLAPGVDLALVSIPKTNFRLGQFEITNEQYKLFAPQHDSGKECSDVCTFSPREMGFPLNWAKQPVCRVSWDEANAFCEWLSQKTGRKFTLPTVSQWQYAALSEKKTPFWFGNLDSDYSRFENLADLNLWRVGWAGYQAESPDFVRWRPSDKNRNDRARVSAPVGSYAPNPWKLYDMMGNVAEWTSSQAIGEKNDVKKIVCGGSWYTPQKEATVDSRRRFRAHIGVFDVGFRVCEIDATDAPDIKDRP